MRALALPAHTAGLAPVDVGLLGVADLTNGGAAGDFDVANFTGGHTQLSEAAFLCDELNRGSSRACNLCAATGVELHSVDNGTQGDVAQGQVVAGLDIGRGAGLDKVALIELGRCQDVTLLAICVVQEGDTSGAVGVVLDVSDPCGHAILVVTTEVDHAVGALVAAATVASSHTAVVVTAASLVQRTHQRLFGLGTSDLDEVGDARTATTRGRGLVLANSHDFPLVLRRSGLLAEDVDGAFTQGHDGALDILARTDSIASAVNLALAVLRSHGGNLHAEDRFDGHLDLGLVRARINFEGVLALIHQDRGLLGDNRTQNDIAGVLSGFDRAHFVSSLVPRNASRAPWVKMTSSLSRTS